MFGDERTTFTTPVAPAIAARTAGFWNGSWASGSRRRSSGRSAKTSARRAGPRRNGFVTSEERNRFRADATLSVPSGSLTAHAQDVGPCTRTPLPSAIPPRRIFSSLLISASR
jgi:hypothetical protein